MKSKIPCIKNIFSEIQPDIALFTETHLTENKGIGIEGYSFFGKARQTGKGGGVGVFVKNTKKHIVAPHYSTRELEILWVSIHRNSELPLYVGVYYGKQEKTCTNATIAHEMDLLSEELLELGREGEILICMDANAKIGLMGEDVSRNGKLIKEVFEECEIEVLNGTEKCSGLITRQNRKRPAERSAIDFVATTYQAKHMVTAVHIDEIGEYRMQGMNESDHNTILVEVQVSKTRRCKMTKKTGWNIYASDEKFALFREKLAVLKDKAEKIMAETEKSITERYTAWEKLLYQAAISTIGKTTYKVGKPPKASSTVVNLRKERRRLKNAFEKETCRVKKKERRNEYIQKQREIKEQIELEESQQIDAKFEKMKRNGMDGFWNARKKTKKDDSSSWLITKDEDGKRIFDPEMNKENVAGYYEDLYKKKPHPDHPYHTEVAETIATLVQDTDATNPEWDRLPTLLEIRDAIEKKKNRKATTDWKNEVLKKGGNEMVRFVAPVIRAFWQEEQTPKQWNLGIITNVWKGKGDRECMKNQRGITVSSAIGTIAEELIFDRVTKLVQFTQAQAGGRKHCSTTDHVFLLRNIITIAKKEKRNVIVTYYDVVKAYDRACMDDMCYAMYKSGVHGKLWRLMRSINDNLTAKVNTKVGLTREIQRETGGKQGGKLMVTLFAKMMDTLAEDMMEDSSLGIEIGQSRISSMLYVDDSMTFAEGYQQQEKTLQEVNEFSLKHKLEWGPDKCKTMEIGNHKEEKSKWKLGDKEIEKCDNYKYLGDIINRNGKNEENLKERHGKLKAKVRAITTCCKNEVMQRIGVTAMLRLHEAEIIPALLNNAETWTLNKTERNMLDKMEIQALKQMIGLPQTTPTAGVILTLGTQFTSVRIDIKQLLYLHRVLQKDDDQWIKTTLKTVNDYNIGWAKNINELLEKWDLEQDWAAIQQKPFMLWKKEVSEAAEIQHKNRLAEECETKSRGETKQKTKTKFVTGKIQESNYSRKVDDFITRHPKRATARALIMGRYHMLKCANNFSTGFKTRECDVCHVLDDEDHRINVCEKWRRTNLCDKEEKISFGDIFSDDDEKIDSVIRVILSVWDLENGKNEMR